MKKFIIAVVGMFLTFLSFAGSPSEWCENNLARTEDSISVYLRVRDVATGTFVETAGSKLAAFSPTGELRGFGEIEGDDGDAKLYQFSIFVSSSTENGLTLKVWDAAKDAVKGIPGTLSAKFGDKSATYSVTDAARKSIGKYSSPVIVDLPVVTTKVSFDANGGTGVGSAVTATNGAAMPAVTKIPTKTGYSFAGYWDQQAADSGKQYYQADGKSANAWDKTDAKATLYAHWTANAYTVRFHKNDGSEVTTTQNFVYDQAQDLAANSFVWIGHTFLGWAETSTGSKKYDDGQNVRNLKTEQGAVLELYAKWKATPYEWTVDGKKVDVQYGDKMTLETESEMSLGSYTNLVCSGWIGTGDVPASGKGRKTAEITVTQPSTITWLWKTNYYFSASATGGGAVSVKTGGYAADAAGCFAPAGTNVVVEASGDMGMFIGWLDELTGASLAGATVTRLDVRMDAAHKVVAKFGVRAKSEISFIGAKESSVTATWGLAMPALAGADVPAKTGYDFLGYFDAPSAGKKYYNADRTAAVETWDREDAKVTFYAQWRAHVYDVRFDANAEDVSGEMDDLTGLVYDTQTKLPACAFVHADAAMKFIGWALEDDKETVVCKDGAWISNLTTEDGATVTLYAVWSEKPTGFAFDQSAVSIEKGETFVLTVYGGSDEAATSVKLNVTYGSAKASDLNLKTATVEGANGVEQTNLKFPLTLSWKKGDVEPKTITIPTTAGKATDAPKCLTWNLANATGLALGEQACCIGTIGAGSSWTTGEVYVLPYVADSAGGKVSGGASVKPDKNGNYKAVTLKATANKGYWFAGWYDAEGTWVSGDLSYKVTPDGSNEMPTYEARFVEAQTAYCGTYNGFAKVNLKGMTLVKNVDASADVYGEYAFTATLSTAGKVSGSITVGGKKIAIKGDSVFTVDETGVTCYAIADEKSCFGGVNSETIVVYFSSDGVANLWRGDDVDPGVGYDPLCNDDSYGMAYKDVSKDKTKSAKFAIFKGTYVGAAIQANDGVVPVPIVIDAVGKVKLSGKYSDGTSLTASGMLGGYMELDDGTKTAELELVMTPKGLGSGAYHLSVFACVYEDGTPSLLLNGFTTTYTAKSVSSAADPSSQGACLFTTGCWIPVNDVELSDPDFGAIRLTSKADGSDETIDILYATKNGVITGLGSSLVSGVTVKFDAKTGFFTVAKGKSYTIQGVLGDYENGCRAAGRINADGSLLPATVEYVKLTPPEEVYPWANEDFSANEDFVLSLGQSFADDMQPTVTSDGVPLALTISGLPTGLKYDKTTGLIAGAPTKSGTSTVKMSYKYGSRTITRVTTLVVAAMPDGMPVGTYAGSATVYIGGDEAKPVDYPFTATIGKTGALTGSITLFGKKATLKASGYDSCSDGTADYTATLDLKSVDRTWGTTTVKISLNDEGATGGESKTFGTGHFIAYVQAFRNQTKDKGYSDSIAPYVGNYLLSYETSADGTVLAETVMSVTVDKKGTAKIAGTFVDGTAFSASSALTLVSDGEEAEVMFPVALKSLGAGGMSVRLVLKVDEETGTVSFDSVNCDIWAAKYILSDDLYKEFSFRNTLFSPMYRYSSRAWVDDELDPDTTCLEVTCESGVFADARFAWTTKTVAGEKQITGVGKTINGSKVTFKIDDKTGLFSGAIGTYKIFGAMDEGNCEGVGTVVGKDGSISPVIAIGVDR